MSKNLNQKDNWNANLYDDNHAFVSNYGRGIVDLLAPQKGEHILDLGCGTGILTNELNNLGVQVIGIDQSENMIEQAQAKYGNITFHVANAVNLKYDNEFDAVFSNAVLHWIKTPKQALHGVYRSLKQGGRFVAEFGGKDNIQMITNEIRKQFTNAGIDYTEDRNPWYYPSVGEYTTLMEQVGFRVIFAAHIDRPTPLKGEEGLKNWLEMFTGSMFVDVPDELKEQVIYKVVQNLKGTMLHEGEWIADYKRLRVIGVKE